MKIDAAGWDSREVSTEYFDFKDPAIPDMIALSSPILSDQEAFSIFLRMVRSRLRMVAKKRGIQNAYQLQKIVDVPIGQAYRLWEDNWTQVNLRTLDKLCKSLRCKPNDLLEFTADSDD